MFVHKWIVDFSIWNNQEASRKRHPQKHYKCSKKLILRNSSCICSHLIWLFPILFAMIYKVYQHPLQVCALHNKHPWPSRKDCSFPQHPSVCCCYYAWSFGKFGLLLAGIRFFFPFPSLTHSRNLWGRINCSCCHHCGAGPWSSKERQEDRLWWGLWEYLQWAGVGWEAWLSIGMGQTTLLLVLIPPSY